MINESEHFNRKSNRNSYRLEKCLELLCLFCLRINLNIFCANFHFRAQMLMKSRLAGAQKGHGLLKKKADALQMRFRQILGKIIEVNYFHIKIYFYFEHKLTFKVNVSL